MTVQPPTSPGETGAIVPGPMPWGLAAAMGVVVGSVVTGVVSMGGFLLQGWTLPLFDSLSGGGCATTHRCGESLGLVGLLIVFGGWLAGSLISLIVVPLVTRRRKTLGSALVSGLVVGLVTASLVLVGIQVFTYSGPEPVRPPARASAGPS